ncbi:MAG: phosphoribosylanthranilate isomerase [Acidiferrobacterales bacterium]|nr:phosphoribosylanthranilate isomerase [Acidiferrobacterales bacterium]
MKRSARFLDSGGPLDSVRTQVKVCGITRLEDAVHALQCGAHALGYIFYTPSKRNMTGPKVKAIKDELPEPISSVAVVVDPDDQLLDEIVSVVRPSFIQFHGDETPERCREPGIPFIKAFRVRSAEQLETVGDTYHDASALLFDAYQPDKVGGTGLTFSWGMVPSFDQPVILAGGLHSGNVLRAIEAVQPDAVDVSTGVEISPGIKNRQAISEFFSAVKVADQSVGSQVA